MPELWRNRTMAVQAALAAIVICLLGLQYWTLLRMESMQRTAVQGSHASGEMRSLPIEKIFSFPEVTCAPKPVPVFGPQPGGALSPAAVEASNMARLARQQFQYGLWLTACIFCGLILGVGLSYRAAARETRLAYLKSAFVSNVSHEMKTPLATIQMFAETLEAGRVKDPARLPEYYRVIHKEARRLGQLIEDVLDFARMESKTRRFRFIIADVSELVEDEAARFLKQVEMSGGRLTVDIQRPVPWVAFDATALGQAVQNLLSNALKYSPNEKDIRITVSNRAGSAAISISDVGIGIPASEHARIFEKFYRADTSLGHNTKGAGLGLAITNHIIKAHGGTIEVESRPKEGSRFTILLPGKGLPPKDPAVRESGKRLAQNTDGEQTPETADRRG